MQQWTEMSYVLNRALAGVCSKERTQIFDSETLVESL